MISTVENLGEKWTHTFAVLDVSFNAIKFTQRSPEKRSCVSLGILPTPADSTMFAASMTVEAAGS